MDDQDFILSIPKGDAILTAQYKDNSFQHFRNLDLVCIAKASSVLAMAFEQTRLGPRHSIEEDVSPAAIISLLRYIFSWPRDYVPEACSTKPVSLLVHAQVYHLADIYDIAVLQAQARCNIIREFQRSREGCMPPLDLCEGIEYIYRSIPGDKAIIDALAHYSVSMYKIHRLGQITSFASLCFKNQQLQNDLCMVSLGRGYNDDVSFAMNQLPVQPSTSSTSSISDPIRGRTLGDVQHDMWRKNECIEGKLVPCPDKICHATYQSPGISKWAYGLPYRKDQSQPQGLGPNGPSRTELNQETKKAIAQTFTAGIASLPPPEIVPWTPYTGLNIPADKIPYHVGAAGSVRAGPWIPQCHMPPPLPHRNVPATTKTAPTSAQDKALLPPSSDMPGLAKYAIPGATGPNVTRAADMRHMQRMADLVDRTRSTTEAADRGQSSIHQRDVLHVDQRVRDSFVTSQAKKWGLSVPPNTAHSKTGQVQDWSPPVKIQTAVDTTSSPPYTTSLVVKPPTDGKTDPDEDELEVGVSARSLYRQDRLRRGIPAVVAGVNSSGADLAAVGKVSCTDELKHSLCEAESKVDTAAVGEPAQAASTKGHHTVPIRPAWTPGKAVTSAPPAMNDLKTSRTEFEVKNSASSNCAAAASADRVDSVPATPVPVTQEAIKAAESDVDIKDLVDEPLTASEDEEFVHVGCADSENESDDESDNEVEKGSDEEWDMV